jgi:hypothetical protein
MILEKGNMWDVFDNTDIFMITTNPIMRQDGAIVMGRGIALEAKSRFPELPYQFGIAYKESQNRNVGMIGRFGLMDTPIWWFMVKEHWREPAQLSIIKESVKILKQIKVSKRVDLNFPGIGNGRLAQEAVLPLLEELENNVHVWEYK